MPHYCHALYLIPIILAYLTSCSTSDKNSTQTERLYVADVSTWLNVRESPSANSTVLGYFLPDDTAHVVGTEGEWAKVSSHNGEIGYVHMGHLRPIDSLPVSDITAGNTTTTPVDPDEHAEPSASHSITIIDSTNVISPADRAAMSQLPAILDRHVIVYATDSLPVKKINEYTDVVRNKIAAGEYGTFPDTMSIFSWIDAYRLLQCADNTNGADYMSIVWPERYFATQQLAQTDGVAAGAIEMARLLAESESEYAGMNWFMRTNFSKETYVEAICDGFVAANILPNDTFWHKWVLGWIFKYPLIIASYIYSFTGSLILSLCLVGFMIIAAGLSIELYVQRKLHDLESASFGLAIAVKIFSAIAWLVMISFVVYMFPDMSTISIAAHSYMPQTVVPDLYRQFALAPIDTGIVSAIIFVLMMIIVGGINRQHILCSSLDSDKQKILYQKEKKDIRRDLMIDNMFAAAEGQPNNIDADKLDRSDTPYTDLVTDSFSRQISTTLFPAIVLAIILNGSLMVFAIIFLSIRLINHIVFILAGVYSMYRNNVYS